MSPVSESLAATPFPGRFWLYARLLRFDRPIGVMLLVWPTLWALWLAAEGRPDAYTVAVFLVGAVLMRSAGCAVNDWADRGFDPHVARTRERPLAAGLLHPFEALLLAGLLTALAALALCSLPFKPAVWALACVAVVLAATYPFFKRFFALPQAYLGLAFGFGIPMAYAATRDDWPVTVGGLMVANLFWTLAYDTEYAMVDRQDDRKLGLRTSALTLGRWDVAGVMLAYVFSLLSLAVVGALEGLGLFYHLGLVLAAGVAAYHGILIRHRDPVRCFSAFRHNAWFGAAVFGGMALDSWLGG